MHFSAHLLFKLWNIALILLIPNCQRCVCLAISEEQQQALGKILWAIADNLRGSMNADDFRDYMLSFLFLRYLSGNYEESAVYQFF
jgi:hypothetical protein